MSGWMKKELGEVCTLQRGFDLPTKQRKEGDYPLISSSGCTDMQAEAKISGPGVVTGRSGSIGSVFFINQDFWPLNTTLYVKDFHGNDPRFIYYLLRKFDLKRFISGTGVPTLNRNSVHGELVYIPSEIDEQKQIVAIVDQAFEAIDGAIENTKQNLANARELFESYLNTVFDRKGDRWKTKRLGDLAEVQSGGTPSRAKNEYWGGSIAWYSSGELNDLHTVSPERHITDQGLENSNAKSFPKSSLLIGMYDTAALKMSILDREAAFNQAIAGVKPNKEIDLVFILHAINYVKPEILNLRRGVRQKNLSLQKIKDVILAVPPLTEQKQVVQQLALMTAETQRLEAIYRQKLADLTELKQSILQKAFSGELTADSAKAR